MDGEGTKVTLRAESNLGYAADQIEGGLVTLADLLEAVQNAILDFGEGAEVVLHQTNNEYGANFGKLDRWNLFELVDTDDEDEDEEEVA